MSNPIQPGGLDPTSLVRGMFHDDLRQYKVRVSSPDAPDSFQVTTGEREDIVLIISGLNSGDLKATWGPFWRSHKPNWRIWIEESAFRVFYSGKHFGNRAPANRPATNRPPRPEGPRFEFPRPEAARPEIPKPMGQHQIDAAPVSWKFCDG